jgi:hypothetical protein
MVATGAFCSLLFPAIVGANDCVYRSYVIGSDTCCWFVSSPSATRSHPKSATIIGFLLSLQFKRFVQCCSIPAGKNHGN